MPGPTQPRRFPYVLFDLGGTLIYFEGKFEEVMPEALQASTRYLRAQGFDLDEQAFPAAYYALLQKYYQQREDTFVEYTSDFILREALRAHSQPEPSLQQVQQALRVMYAVTQSHWHLEKDTVSTLKALRASGRVLGLVSNAADDEDVQTLVDQAGIRRYFDFILTSAVAGFRKPSPSIFEQALFYWNAQPKETVMVGDTLPADITGAQELGIAAVWISRRAEIPPAQARQQGFHPDATIDTLAELPALLDNWS